MLVARFREVEGTMVTKGMPDFETAVPNAEGSNMLDVAGDR